MKVKSPREKSFKLFALVDCNNFFASCERIFRPDLAIKPVAVLSNNDGCIVARSNEVKSLGVPMAAPYFEWRKVFKEAEVAVFSANFALYSDISKRLINVFEAESPEVEVYSIDESFMILQMRPTAAAAWAKRVRERALREIGVPVSVGVAPSKTLAKAASEYAKKQLEENGVTIITSVDSAKYRQVLSWLPVEDVWGVGRRLAPKLRNRGIYTALALSEVSYKWARASMTVKGEQMIRELRGQACLGLNEANHDQQKSMLVSRSFSKEVRNLSELEVAVASYVASLAHKLRKHNQLAVSIGVFAISSYHKQNFVRIGGQISFDIPTSDNVLLTKGALGQLKENFRPGFSYKKAGVFVSELVGLDGRQMSLLAGVDEEDIKKEIRRGEVFEKLEGRWGRGIIKSGAALGQHLKEGEVPAWRSASQIRSPEYTTRWRDIPVVKAG